MTEKQYPETLQVLIDNEANDHMNVDGSVGCEGGARSSSRESTIFSDRKSKPLDEAIKEKLSKLIKK